MTISALLKNKAISVLVGRLNWYFELNEADSTCKQLLSNKGVEKMMKSEGFIV